MNDLPPPPALTTWPTLADERVLLAANPEAATKFRALLHRIRELEDELAVTEHDRDLAECERYAAEESAAPPLTKAAIEVVAEQLLTAGSGFRADTILDRDFADVVHLLCSELGVKE